MEPADSRFDASLAAATGLVFASIVVFGTPLLGALVAAVPLAVGLTRYAPAADRLLLALASAGAVLLVGAAIPMVVLDLPSVGVRFDPTTLLVVALTASLLALAGSIRTLRRLRAV